MNITASIDARGLWNGIQAAAQYSKRTMAQMVNTSAYWVAVNAKADMPFVTAQKVDAELSVITTPVIGKRGKALKNKKTFSGGISTRQQNWAAPLAVLIVAARGNPASRYNQLTNQRYALTASPFKDRSRAEGQAAMAALVDKMFKSRHRSGKFLLAGWIPVIRGLLRFTASKFLRGGPAPSEGAKSFYGGDLGHAEPAQEGAIECSATIVNEVGMEGQNAPNYNRALNLYGLPALQRAVDVEGERQMAYALGKMEGELASTVNKHWG